MTEAEQLRVPADEPGGDRRELSESDFLCLHRPECLPALEYFTLRDSSVGDEGLRLILEAPFFRRLKGLDLSRCTAYSDSFNDVPMLTLVGHAVAVNPDTGLREQARASGWEVRDFRTGRKAAKIGVPAAAGLGAAAGGVVGGLALRRRYRQESLFRRVRRYSAALR